MLAQGVEQVPAELVVVEEAVDVRAKGLAILAGRTGLESTGPAGTAGDGELG